MYMYMTTQQQNQMHVHVSIYYLRIPEHNTKILFRPSTYGICITEIEGWSLITSTVYITLYLSEMGILKGPASSLVSVGSASR